MGISFGWGDNVPNSYYSWLYDLDGAVMNKPPLSQAQILHKCKEPYGFSILVKHAHFDSHSKKLAKLIDKGLIRMSKRLGDDGGVFEAV